MAREMIVLLVAVGLGLRHALDPDHLVAVTGLAVEGDGQAPRRIARVGFAWGVGHATTLALAGLALMRLGWNADLWSGHSLERLVGVAIVLIGVRLFVLQRSRRLMAFPPQPGQERYRLAFTTGLLHGLAGSGSVTLALLALVDRSVATPALLLFAVMTCVSMTLCALALGTALSRPGLRNHFGQKGRRAVAVASIVFGTAYAAFA